MSLAFLASQADLSLIGKEALNLLSQAYSERFPGLEIEVEVECLSLEGIARLNLASRGLGEPTDVLSFPTFAGESEIAAEPAGIPVLIGGIALCPQKAAMYNETLPQLIHHGLLHLIGYDHEEDMARWAGAEAPVLSRLAALGLPLPSMTADAQHLA